MQQSRQRWKIRALSQLHRNPALSVVRLGRARCYASAKNVLLDILRKTDVNPVGTMNMSERLSSNAQLNIISTAVKSLNAGHEKHLACNDIQQTH